MQHCASYTMVLTSFTKMAEVTKQNTLPNHCMRGRVHLDDVLLNEGHIVLLYMASVIFTTSYLPILFCSPMTAVSVKWSPRRAPEGILWWSCCCEMPFRLYSVDWQYGLAHPLTCRVVKANNWKDLKLKSEDTWVDSLPLSFTHKLSNWCGSSSVKFE